MIGAESTTSSWLEKTPLSWDSSVAQKGLLKAGTIGN